MIQTNILCPDCMKGRLEKASNEATLCTCDRCGTQFVQTGTNRVRYANSNDLTPPATSGKDGGVMANGKRCSIHSFADRKHYEPPAEDMARYNKTVATRVEDIPDADDGSKYEWVEIGHGKYGRSMLCLKTGIYRTQTMGEFYQSATVD